MYNMETKKSTKTATLSVRITPVLDELIHRASKARQREKPDWTRLALEKQALADIVELTEAPS